MNKKEAVRLIRQAIANLPTNYPFKPETSQAFGFLDLFTLADTAYHQITGMSEKPEGFVVMIYEDIPFKRFNPSKVTSPCSHIGEIKVNYKTLLELFGRHDKYHDTYKQDASWHIEFQNGDKVAIGNYKDGHNYLGKKGRNLVDINRWDVWGTEKGLKMLKGTIESGRRA